MDAIPSQPFVVLVDQREDDKVKKRLHKLEGVKIIDDTNLPFGDYVIGDTNVERKSIGDFLGSLYAGKLFRQVEELATNSKHPILIVHGDLHKTLSWNRGDARRSHLSFLSAQAAIARMGVPTIYVEEDEEYAETILSLVRQSDPNRPEGERPILTRKKNREPEDVKSDMLCAIDGIGRKQARALLKEFGSVRKLANATEDQIKEMDGFGTEKAKKIVEVFK